MAVIISIRGYSREGKAVTVQIRGSPVLCFMEPWKFPRGADWDMLLLLLPPSGKSCKKKVEISCGRNISFGCLQSQNWFLFWERPPERKRCLLLEDPSSLRRQFIETGFLGFFFCLIILERVKSKASQSSENNSWACLWDYLSFY